MKHKADAKAKGLKFSRFENRIEYWVDKQGVEVRYHIDFKLWLS